MTRETLVYPRHVHKPSKWAEWVSLVVQNADECARALENGWSLTASVIPETPNDAPVAAPEPILEPSAPEPEPKRRGRPRKA